MNAMLWLRWTVLVASTLSLYLFQPVAAWSDSWSLPRTATYQSRNQQYRLTVQPRQLDSQLSYFQDKVDGAEPAGQREGAPSVARGRLERLDGSGRWGMVWDKPLVNEVSPVSALVSEDGAYVVTLDNWHSVGWGDEVIVIYNAQGEVVRAFGLRDFLPESYVDALPHSVSSIWWGSDHRIEGADLVLRIVVPSYEEDDGQAHDDGEPDFIEARVTMSSGVVAPLTSDEWRHALSEGERVDARNRADRAEELEWRRTPLTAPTGSRELEWHQYLREAFFRLDPEWKDVFPLVQVLRSPTADDYEPSVGWLRDELRDEHEDGDRVMIGSPDVANLVSVLETLLPDARQNRLSGVTVYVCASDEYWPRVERAFADTGASLVQLRPGDAIPQRPERFPDADGEGPG